MRRDVGLVLRDVGPLLVDGGLQLKLLAFETVLIAKQLPFVLRARFRVGRNILVEQVVQPRDCCLQLSRLLHSEVRRCLSKRLPVTRVTQTQAWYSRSD